MKTVNNEPKNDRNTTIRMGRSSTHVRDDGGIDILIPLATVSGPNSPEEIFAVLPSEPKYAGPADPIVYGELWGYTDSEVKGGLFKLRAIFRDAVSLAGVIGLLDRDNTLIRVVQASMTLARLNELGARGRVLSPPLASSEFEAKG